MRRGACQASGGELSNCVIGSTFRIVEPLADESLDQVPAVLLAQLLYPALGDAARTKRREIVAVPHVRHANPPAAHSDDVVDILIPSLHPHAREIQPAFLVD